MAIKVEPQPETAALTGSEEEAFGIPFWPPFRLAASGLYTWRFPISIIPRQPIPLPKLPPIPDPGPWRGGDVTEAGDGQAVDTATSALFPILSERIRLDVDGRYPQMVVSGDMSTGLFSTVHWIANLTKTGSNTYVGAIWYRDPPVAPFPYDSVKVTTGGGWLFDPRTATVTFSGPGGIQRTRTYTYTSPYFHDVDLEVDFQTGVTPATSFATCSHPNRPATLPCETLTIGKVFQRAGFNVTSSPSGTVPVAGAGANATWSNQEMHDAMQVYWSHYAPKAQWATWIFFAATHDMGHGLGGIMFDDIGPQQRQGTSIFIDSFISDPAPAGDPAPAAFIDRMRFWTGVHETGHAFNLAHAWQKSLTSGGKGPWLPLVDEPESRSFMNYPYFVAGGTTAFFADFEYRFSDQELLFMRHAPSSFVQQGNALWFDHHGFLGANALPEPTYQLVVRANRDRPSFEFMEPVTLELKLTNATAQPQIVDEHILDVDQGLVVIITKKGEPTRQLLPIARLCRQASQKVLQPAESVYAPMLASVGPNGWNISDPGTYGIQVCLHLPTGEDILSNELRVIVEPARTTEDETLAQDYFTEDVGRVIALEGSRVLDTATDTLTEIADKLRHRRVAVHANLVLGVPLATEYKVLSRNRKHDGQQYRIEALPARPEEAKDRLVSALSGDPTRSAESFGHVRYKESVDQLTGFLESAGDAADAYKQQDIMLETLSGREVRGRKVLDSVLKEIKTKRDSLASAAGVKSR
ncbi:MAG TPA: hypothetical protein VIZ22_07695 [Candidatus Limnocylindrales bacterium]